MATPFRTIHPCPITCAAASAPAFGSAVLCLARPTWPGLQLDTGLGPRQNQTLLRVQSHHSTVHRPSTIVNSIHLLLLTPLRSLLHLYHHHIPSIKHILGTSRKHSLILSPPFIPSLLPSFESTVSHLNCTHLPAPFNRTRRAHCTLHHGAPAESTAATTAARWCPGPNWP